jgi:energy-coupling factor transport system permease protein
MILLMTTSVIKLTAGLEYLLIPLGKLNIPIHNFTTVLSISLRFLPTLFEEATTIKNAQISRGSQFNSPRILVRLKSYVAILIPLFESSLVRAAELGEAMDSRCYTPHPNQLRISSLKMKGKDIFSLVIMGAILVAGILISIISKRGFL